MGDRCAVELLCRKEDLKRFEDAGFVEVDWGKQPEHLVRVMDEQANYANESELIELARQGVAFFGASGAGAEYPPTVFAGDGKRYVSADCLDGTITSKPVAEVGPDGNVDPKTLGQIRRYYKALGVAKKKLRFG